MIRTKVIQNRWLPGRGFLAITLFGLVFTRNRKKIDHEVLNHEKIHCQQQLEWLYLPFFLIYGCEWLWHLLRKRNSRAAYYAISFEREAYAHQADLDYLKHRPLYGTWRSRKLSLDHLAQEPMA